MMLQCKGLKLGVSGQVEANRFERCSIFQTLQRKQVSSGKVRQVQTGLTTIGSSGQKTGLVRSDLFDRCDKRQVRSDHCLQEYVKPYD